LQHAYNTLLNLQRIKKISAEYDPVRRQRAGALYWGILRFASAPGPTKTGRFQSTEQGLLIFEGKTKPSKSPLAVVWPVTQE